MYTIYIYIYIYDIYTICFFKRKGKSLARDEKSYNILYIYILNDLARDDEFERLSITARRVCTAAVNVNLKHQHMLNPTTESLGQS